jgi:hypothetical protein
MTDALLLISCVIIQLVVSLFGSQTSAYAASGGLATDTTLPSSGISFISGMGDFIWQSMTFQVPDWGPAVGLAFWILLITEVVLAIRLIRGV